MARTPRVSLLLTTLLSASLLGACGGDSRSSGSSTPAGNSPGGVTPTPAPAPAPSPAPPPSPAPAPGPAPTLAPASATEGLNQFNLRRQQIGLRPLARSGILDTAAQNHSVYQSINDQITHDEDPAKPGFTGRSAFDRIRAAGYRLAGSYSFGEVISSTTSTSGVNAAEALIAAIYHRFLIFEPMFHEAGAGAAYRSGDYMYFTVNFGSSPLDYSRGLPTGGFVTYPSAGQTAVPVNFFSDFEIPDPVPNKNEVGYPISVHANINATIRTTSFTVRPRGGNALPTVTVQGDVRNGSGPSAVSIIPTDRLAAGTTYEVQFSGTIDGQPAARTWTFTTR